MNAVRVITSSIEQVGVFADFLSGLSPYNRDCRPDDKSGLHVLRFFNTFI
jgi:hypothetical protein